MEGAYEPHKKGAKADDLDEVRTRYNAAREACEALYNAADDDVRFVTIPGEQWDEALKARRRNRKCYEFPKLPAQVRQVVNEMRQGRPQGKVRGTEEGDAGLAEIMQGLCRNIESTSNADLAYDIAYDAAVKGGFGAWRICTDYANNDDFDLDIRIKPILDWRCVKFDPGAVERDRRDGRFAFVEQVMSRSAFEREYPDADISDFFTSPQYVYWAPDNDKVRIAEYWYKTISMRTLLLVTRPDGQEGTVLIDEKKGVTEDSLTQLGFQITARRKVEHTKVCMRLTNGKEWLSEEQEFPSKFIPIIPLWGNIDTIDGADYWQGMVRSNKDQQRLHNVFRTSAIEFVAKAPKSPLVAKPKWVKGFEPMWNAANVEDFPVLFIDDMADGTPQRVQAAEVPVAMIQLGNLMNEDIKASTGQHDASLGARSNETSGKAISARQSQGATSTFNYIDNLAYSIRFMYEILVDMIPRVYDTRRVVRILGEDGAAKWKTLYQEVQDPETGQMRTLNDISKGKYDVSVTVGPSFATQRMEAADGFMQLLGQIGPTLPPPIANVLAYTTVKNMDMPGSEEASEVFRKFLVQAGVMPPKEGEDPPPQQQGPSPMDMAEVKKILAQAASYEADADKKTAEAVQTQLQNILASEEFAQQLFAQFQQMSAGGAGPPMPGAPPGPMPGQIEAPTQPPQGGFSLAGAEGFAG
jgi:hypothetical protein